MQGQTTVMALNEDPDYKHFSFIPWCAEILQNPDLVVVRATRRQSKANTEDAFWAETLKTKTTVPAFLTLYRKPKSPNPAAPIDELKALLTLGPGVNGYPNVCHGGVVGAIIDQVMGLLLQQNRLADGSAFVTASLKTTYFKPVPTPGTIVVTARLKEVDGRKYHIEAMMQDDRGEVLASGDALWIAVRANM